MIDTSSEHTADSIRASQTSREPSDLLANYERLLGLFTDQLRKEEINPYESIPLLIVKSFSLPFHMRFWKYAAHFFKIPNTLRQELAGGALILQELERLDYHMLRGIAECNRINLRRLLGRSVFGRLPKLIGAFVFLLTLPKAIKEGFGTVGTDLLTDMLTDILKVLPFTVMWPVALGLLLGSVVNLIILLPSLGIVRALDDLIAIALAHRGTPKQE